MLFHYKPGIVQQYFRLLRILYRPQNVFYIHIDAKSPKQWISQIKQFAVHFTILAYREVVESLEQAKGKNLITTGKKIRDLSNDSIDKQRVMFKCAWNGRRDV